MKIDKSLEEVWRWKEEINEETKGMTLKQRVNYINKTAETFCKKHNLRLKKVNPSPQASKVASR